MHSFVCNCLSVCIYVHAVIYSKSIMQQKYFTQTHTTCMNIIFMYNSKQDTLS